MTFSAPSEIAVDGGKLFVYFDSLKAANVYTVNGEFLYSVYQYENVSNGSNQHDGKEYRLGSRGVWYADESGEKVFIIKYPVVNTILNANILWLANACLIAFTIALRFMSDEYKRPVSASIKSDEAKEDTSDSAGSFSDFSDETAAS